MVLKEKVPVKAIAPEKIVEVVDKIADAGSDGCLLLVKIQLNGCNTSLNNTLLDKIERFK